MTIPNPACRRSIGSNRQSMPKRRSGRAKFMTPCTARVEMPKRSKTIGAPRSNSRMLPRQRGPKQTEYWVSWSRSMKRHGKAWFVGLYENSTPQRPPDRRRARRLPSPSLRASEAGGTHRVRCCVLGRAVQSLCPAGGECSSISNLAVRTYGVPTSDGTTGPEVFQFGMPVGRPVTCSCAASSPAWEWLSVWMVKQACSEL